MSTLIQVDHLSIANADYEIIKDLSFEIEEGEFVSITGPSGSGKSTVLKYLAQLNDPTLKISGEYHLDKKPVNDYKPVELRQLVSYCYQTPTLFGDMVRDNLAFPYEIRHETFDEERAADLLSKVALDGTFLDKAITSLSGGERQRVALVRNLLYPAKVLLLDEVSSALDLPTRELVWEWLNQYRKDHKVTILMVSHIEQEHAMADRRIEIKKLKKGLDTDGE